MCICQIWLGRMLCTGLSLRSQICLNFTSFAETKMPLLFCNLWEGSEGKGALDLADMILQNCVRAESLGEVETVFNLEALAHWPLLGAGAHCARRDPLRVSDLNPRPTDIAADPLFPQVEVDSRQG